MRKLVVLAAAATLLAASAVAQEVVPVPIAQLVGSVTPPGPENRHPIVQLGLTLNKESGATAKRITWTLPRSVRLRLGAFPRCAPSRAQRRKCRTRARVGAARMVAATGDAYTPRAYEAGVFAGGRRKLTFAFRAPGQRVVRSARLRGRKLTLTLPRALRRALGGPTYLTNLRLELGGRRRLVALRRCRRPGYEYAVRIGIVGKPAAAATARSRCPA